MNFNYEFNFLFWLFLNFYFNQQCDIGVKDIIGSYAIVSGLKIDLVVILSFENRFSYEIVMI